MCIAFLGLLISRLSIIKMLDILSKKVQHKTNKLIAKVGFLGRDSIIQAKRFNIVSSSYFLWLIIVELRYWYFNANDLLVLCTCFKSSFMLIQNVNTFTC